MAITSARMQIKRGNEVDFYAEQMLVGEWALSTDERIVRICVAPNVCIRMATYDAFEVDMAQIEEILEECQTIEDAVELINSQVSEKLQATIEYTNQAKGYRDEAKQFRDEMAAVSDIGLATTEKAGLVKPDGTTIRVDEDGTIHADSGTVDYEALENKPSINSVELSGNKSLNELGITTSDTKDNVVTFIEADERENIITNENHATLFGKIAKWFSDLKTHAFVNPIANLLTTETGYALDATQGKILDDKISAVSNSLSGLTIIVTHRQVTTDGQGIVWIGERAGYIPISAYTHDIQGWTGCAILGSNDGSFGVQVFQTWTPMPNATLNISVVYIKANQIN